MFLLKFLFCETWKKEDENEYKRQEKQDKKKNV